MKTTATYLLFTAIAALLLPSVAQAQFAPDNRAPIDLEADDIVNQAGITILSGQVDVRQGDVRILSDKMKIYSGGNASTGTDIGNISKIEAEGNFYYITPDQEVRGTRGLYERKRDSFVVTGDVILLQGPDNVVTGDRLVYNLTSREAQVTSLCKGRRCGPKKRVRILIKNQSSN